MKLLEAGNKTGSSDLYKGLASFCNAEMSKHVLGNTLTTEAGEKGTQALGTVQKKSEELLLEKDKRFVLNVLNYEMTDLLESFGYPVRGGRFAFVSEKNTDPTKRVDILTKLNALGLPLDHDQLYEEFGLNKPKDYDRQMASKQKQEPLPSAVPVEPEKKEEKRTFHNLLSRFFGEAPDGSEGALGW